MGTTRSTYGGGERCIQDLVGKAKGKRPFGRQRRRWVHIIKMDFQKVIWRGKDWIDLAQNSDKWRTLANALMNIRLP